MFALLPLVSLLKPVGVLTSVILPVAAVAVAREVVDTTAKSAPARVLE